jgi:hypothetical protein
VLLALAAAALTACGPDPDPTPAPEPSPTGSPVERLADFTGLTPPETAEDIDVTEDTTGDDRRRMTASFRTDRAAADAFCAADGLDVYHDPEGPTEEEREAFAAGADTVDGATTCRGISAEAGPVQREILVLYPEDDHASVHVIAYEYD